MSSPTHVCLDCGALGYVGGYHDHGNGNAGDTVALRDLPSMLEAFQRDENIRYELEDEVVALRARLAGTLGVES